MPTDSREIERDPAEKFAFSQLLSQVGLCFSVFSSADWVEPWGCCGTVPAVLFWSLAWLAPPPFILPSRTQHLPTVLFKGGIWQLRIPAGPSASPPPLTLPEPLQTTLPLGPWNALGWVPFHFLRGPGHFGKRGLLSSPTHTASLESRCGNRSLDGKRGLHLAVSTTEQAEQAQQALS